ncbi:hypothetical protein ACFQ9U_24075 [Streptomyces sp. NPDC056568]|uniref:hypothetical protein n=1 Tax=Streptomyces sp. NPDC056568 TaxID=3345866 RepID=UPI00368B5068
MSVLLLLLAIAVVTAVVLGRNADTLGRRPYPATRPAAPGPPGAGAPWRALAGVAGAGAVLLYAWGALCVGFAVMGAEDGGTDSSPMQPCRTGVSQELSGRVIDYDASLLPLGFRCETTDGGGYDSAEIPGYANPGVAVLALTAVAGAVVARRAAGRQARAAAR